jgi:poly(A) polymerase
MRVLGELSQIINDWIFNIYKEKGKSEEECLMQKAQIFTFGSYRLGVHSANTDMDVLCVVPRDVDRDKHFFNNLAGIFRENQYVKELKCVKEAFVPIMTMFFMGVELDLLFARIEVERIQEELDLKDDSVLKNCDEKTILSLNGCRVTDMILKLVPN